MNKQTKILVFGGIGLAILSFFAFNTFIKKKTPSPIPPRPNPKPCNPLVDKNCQSYDEDDYPSQVLSVVTREGTRLRSEPSTDSEILKTFNKGVVLYVFNNIIQDDGLWYNVDDGEFLSGWVRSDVVDGYEIIRDYSV